MNDTKNRFKFTTEIFLKLTTQKKPISHIKSKWIMRNLFFCAVNFKMISIVNLKRFFVFVHFGETSFIKLAWIIRINFFGVVTNLLGSFFNKIEEEFLFKLP